MVHIIFSFKQLKACHEQRREDERITTSSSSNLWTPHSVIPNLFSISLTLNIGSENQYHLTFPTYCGSDPMYSSRTKNWFHTHPLLTLWTPIMPCFLCAIMFLCCSFPILLWDEEWRGETKLLSKRHQRNSSRQFPMSIGTTFRCKDGYRWLLWWRQRSNESNMKNSAKPQRNGTTNIHGIPGALEI